MHTLPELIQWHEGMALLPQHFQQSSLRYESLLQCYYTLANINYYGLGKFEIDKNVLQKGIFRVNFIDIIMQDGLYVSIKQDSELKVKELELPKIEEYKKGRLSIYFCVPKIFENNYFIGKDPRYIGYTEFQPTVDINTGHDPINIPRVYPNYKILTEQDVTGKYNAVKIAELKIDKNMWILSDYVPPSFKVNKNSQVLKICSEISFTMRSKINYISDILKLKSSGKSISFITENKLNLIAISNSLPYLEAQISQEESHPFQLYLSLCNILGSIGSMSESLIPSIPPTYNHDDMIVSFQKLKNEITEILQLVVNEKIDSSLFIKENNQFFAEIKKRNIKNSSILIGIRVDENIGIEQIHMWISSCVIYDKNKIDNAIENRVLGYKRIHIDRTESFIPPRAIILYRIEIENTDLESQEISLTNQDKNLAIPSQILLYEEKE